MDVSYVVDHKTQSEGELVSRIGELSGNLLVVGCVLVVSGVGQHADKSVQGLDDVGRSHLKGVIRRRATLVIVRNVDEVPA